MVTCSVEGPVGNGTCHGVISLPNPDSGASNANVRTQNCDHVAMNLIRNGRYAAYDGIQIVLGVFDLVKNDMDLSKVAVLDMPAAELPKNFRLSSNGVSAECSTH